MNEQKLEKRIAEIQEQMEQQSHRFQTFLSLTRQAYGCIEFDTPISTRLPPAQQASFMLAARLVECNDEFAKMYNASHAEDLTGARFVSLILAAEKFIVRARRFVTSGYRLINEEIEHARSDGTRQVLIANVVGEISHSRLTRMWITMEDVTFQRLIAEVASNPDRDLPAMAQRLDHAFWLMDWQAFKVIYVGPVYEQVWQQSSEKLLKDPMSWLEAVHPDDRQRVNGAFLTQVAKGGYDETFRMVLPDGTIKIIRDRGFPIPDSTGLVHRIVGLATDITEPKEAVADSNHFFNRCQEMLAVINADGTIRQVNGSFCKVTGYAEQELTGQRMADLIHPDDRESTREMVAKLSEGVPAVDVRNRFLCKDASWKDLEWNVAPVSETGTICATAQDVTHLNLHQTSDLVSAMVDKLTPREVQVMRLIEDGRTNKSIANDLGISQRTVEKHRQRVMNKLELTNVPDLVRLAILWDEH